jgi:type IV pilus assembly protein PilB
VSQPTSQGRASRPRIGEVLHGLGLVSAEELETALAVQADTGERVGQILVRLGIVSDVQVSRALADAAGIPFVDLDEVKIDPSVARVVPQPFARRNSILAYERDGETLVVAMSNPADVFALDDLRTITNRPVRAVMGESGQIARMLDRVWGAVGMLSGAPGTAPPRIVEEPEEPDIAELVAAGGDQGPAVQVVNDLINRAAQERASDIHLEPAADHLRVRFRVDGIARDVATFPRHLEASVMSRIKIITGMDITERRVPQDGRLSVVVAGDRFDIRAVTLPTVHGEAIVLRLLNQSGELPRLSDIGMLPATLDAFRAAYAAPNGLILVTGPTGSGKSTTLYTTLREINDASRTVVTVEDPVEYRMAGTKQIPVDNATGLTFATALRAILRSDPDVVLVGEIRDPETARIASEAALTGHLVLSTLHTNSAAASPARLIEMGVPAYLVVSSLRCVLAQRLVRKLCRCREPYRPSAAALAAAGVPEGFSPSAELQARFCQPRGCSRCAGTGYLGRIAVIEVMSITPDVSEVVLDHGRSEEVEAVALGQGMTTMRVDGIHKAAAGITTLDEVLRVTPDSVLDADTVGPVAAVAGLSRPGAPPRARRGRA